MNSQEKIQLWKDYHIRKNSYLSFCDGSLQRMYTVLEISMLINTGWRLLSVLNDKETIPRELVTKNGGNLRNIVWQVSEELNDIIDTALRYEVPSRMNESGYDVFSKEACTVDIFPFPEAAGKTLH